MTAPTQAPSAIPQKIEIPTTLPLIYLHWPAEVASPTAATTPTTSASKKRLVLFLHGYTDSARSFLKRAWPERAPEYDVLAPNGPFPVPVKSEAGYKPAYAWYFLDESPRAAVEKTGIPPAVSIEMLLHLIQHLGLDDHEKVIVGFSQGGLLAPRLALKLKNVRRIIGIGTNYQSPDYAKIPHIPVDAIHGDKDSVLPLVHIEKGLRSIQELGFHTELFVMKDLEHTMNDEARAKLKERVALAFR